MVKAYYLNNEIVEVGEYRGGLVEILTVNGTSIKVPMQVIELRNEE